MVRKNLENTMNKLSAGNDVEADFTSEQPATHVDVHSILSDLQPAKWQRRTRVSRTIAPSLIIALGGSAGQILSRVKKLLATQGTDSYAWFVAIDTDEKAQAGAEGCPGFTDEEFVHIKMDRVRNVIQNPKSHKRIVERLGTDDPENSAFHERLLNEGLEQAGQVRSFGELSLLAEYQRVRSAIRGAIGHLNGAHSHLEKQLQSQNRVSIQRHMNIYVVFSNAGGTGSSMALEVMALLRELTKQMHAEVVGYMVMPSTFDSVMEGRPEQEKRIRANAFATTSELNAFREGFGTQQGITLGPDERDVIPVSAGLFNQLVTISRNMADGRDLRTPEAVFDTAALHLAADIGTEIADRIDIDDANQATLRGLTPDPTTGKSRYVSTIGATALTFPVGRVARACAARAMHSFIQERVLGAEPGLESVDQAVEAWTAQPLDGESMIISAAATPGILRRAVLSNPSTLIRPLFQVVTGTQRVYYKDSVFPQHADRLKQNFQKTQIPDFESRLGEIGTSLIEDLTSSLKKQVARIARDSGWREVREFCRSLTRILQRDAETMSTGSQADYEHAKVSFSKVKDAIVPLQTFWGSFGTDRKRQDLVAEHLQNAMTAAVDSITRITAHRVVKAIIAEVASYERVASDVVTKAGVQLEQAQSAFEDARAGRSVTTDSQAEIDVSTPATDKSLFRTHRIDNSTILDQLSKSLSKSPADTLRGLVSTPGLYESLSKKLLSHFLDRFEAVSVVDVLADQLSDPKTERSALTRIREAVVGCQPLWRAESGQLGVEFADTMIVGLPESDVSVKRELVAGVLKDVASHRIHANGQYNGRACQVTSGDMHRIYIIRRTQGACLHYLPEVLDCQVAYEQWNKMGGHSVHIFNAETVSRMPSILPKSDIDDGDLAFALGLAYGFIANRGPHWYWNLAVDKSRGNTLVCRLTSHWDGIAFQNQTRAVSRGALATFVGTNRLVYEVRDDMLVSDKLAQGMDNALQAVLQNGEMIETILTAFNDMRAAAGDAPVADELEGYVTSLKKRTRSSAQNYDTITKMLGLLSQQVTELRRS